MSYNHVTLIGNLTRDPELRYTPKGTAVCKFTLAINESYTPQGGEKRESVSYIDITAWGKQGEVVAQYLKKGKPLMVVGSLKQETWEDKNTREKKSKIGVTMREFVFVGAKGESESLAQPRAAATPADSAPTVAGDEPPDGDDAPF